ncbi:arylsulfatase B-like isoform X1 [Diabrotica virgifera virgifera]|uniref:Sulfatase N-terminal domain-containing protein n=2 Tax=Diabrotica virgifera virgifera TaxID=50390 RepID=A0ABM5JPW7_DIAVI|nr:arylsulfatase B-like isoform X1 [Diabrotica virgifera virgifera]
MKTSQLFLLFLSATSVNSQEKQIHKQPPHIVIILADDVGWNDFGLHGSSQIPTPNIDALGYNGVILDKFYTQQTCTPSRAALLTGKYPIRMGLQGIPLDAGENRSLPLNIRTMPERLKELGYSTHLVGKWHLGAACEEVTPTRRGFDTHFGYWSGFVGYFNHELSVPNPLNKSENFTGLDFRDNFTPQWSLEGKYVTELFSKKAIDIIHKHNTSKPLFLMLAHLAGHTGSNGTELGVPNKAKAEEKYKFIQQNERRSYADLVNIMDTSVGDIVQKLSERQMLENSVILFFSDNGAQTEGLYQNFGSSWPFRGLKFTLFEGGVRGTGVIYSPLFKLKSFVSDQLVHITDFLPTFYHAAGGDIRNLGKIDGFNQWEVISKNKTTKRTDLLINIDDVNHYSGILGYNGRYKLLNGSFSDGIYNDYYGDSGRNSGDPPYDLKLVLNSPTNLAIQKIQRDTYLDSEKIQALRKQVDIAACRSGSELFKCNSMCLFDLYNDPCETRNLIKDENVKDVVKALKGKYFDYLKEVVPQAKKQIEPKSNPRNFNNTWSPWISCIASKKRSRFIDEIRK